MKELTDSDSRFEKISSQERQESNTCDSSNEPDVKKQVSMESLSEPTRLFFSSSCFLSEFEDNEDVLKL